MFEKEQIEMRDIDRAVLLAQKDEQEKRRKYYYRFSFIAILFSLVVTGVIGIVFRELALLLLFCVMIVAYTVCNIIRNYHWIKKPRIDKRLKYSDIELIRCSSSMMKEVIGLSEKPTHRGLLVQYADNQMAFFHGEYLEDLFQNKTVLNDSFELVFSSDRKFFIQGRALGKPLENIDSIHYGEFELNNIWLPDDGTSIEGNFDDIPLAFKRVVDSSQVD